MMHCHASWRFTDSPYNVRMPESKPFVAIIMGSKSDWDTMRNAVETLDGLGVPNEARVLSAHRTPDATAEFARNAADRGLRVIIAGAGGAAHLAGVIAAHTWLPVLGVPIQSKLQGLDSLLSTVQMPGGIPVGTLAIGEAGAEKAAPLSAAVLAPSHHTDRHPIESLSQETVGSGNGCEIAKVKTVISTDRAAAVELLRKGGIVALPTETVYGLAADALNPIAVAKIFEAKERPRFDPLIVHLPSEEWLEKIADLPAYDQKLISELADKFWPGPFTIVLPRLGIVPEIVTAGLDTVAIRISAHPVFAEIIDAFAKPLAAPSANRFGRVSPTTAQHVLDELEGRIPLIVDAGATQHGIESTI